MLASVITSLVVCAFFSLTIFSFLVIIRHRSVCVWILMCDINLYTWMAGASACRCMCVIVFIWITYEEWLWKVSCQSNWVTKTKRFPIRTLCVAGFFLSLNVFFFVSVLILLSLFCWLKCVVRREIEVKNKNNFAVGKSIFVIIGIHCNHVSPSPCVYVYCEYSMTTVTFMYVDGKITFSLVVVVAAAVIPKYE